MERITIDDALAARLRELAERSGRVVLVDAAGRVVGYASPRAEVGELEDVFTPEEIERMFAPNQKTYTTDEVLAMLCRLP